MPRLVVCRCDPDWPAYSACDRCELAQLEAALRARHVLKDDHPAQAAWSALLASWEATVALDRADAADRERDLADDWRLAQ